MKRVLIIRLTKTLAAFIRVLFYFFGSHNKNSLDQTAE